MSMNIYFFYADPQKINRSLLQAESILTLCGNRVITNKEKSEKQFREQEVLEAQKTGVGLLHKIDGFILDLSEPQQEVGYFIALAVLHGKPCLCLYPRGIRAEWVDFYAQQVRQYKKIVFRPFTRSNFKMLLNTFSDEIRSGFTDKDDIPSLKYTLRISPRIDRYLRWKAAHGDISKADYIRDAIKKMMESDQSYKKLSDQDGG